MATTPRNRDLAAIHATRKQLGMDEETYRAMLRAVGGVDSARDLDVAGRRKVLDHLRGKGGQFKRPVRSAGEWAFVDAAAEDRRPLLRRIIVFCRELGIERGGQKRYVEGIARQMSGNAPIDKPLEFCSHQDLHSIALALDYALRRQERRGR